jgi:hypothetical protein
MGLGSGIRDPGSGKNLFRILDPGVKKAPYPGSGSATLENIISFLLMLISKKLSRKEGKVNTILHGQGAKHRHSTPPAKVEQIIAWPRRKNIKTQGEKISYFPPV